MAKRMLIDATHSEETRVVVHSENRLEDFDFETLSKKQLKGNIYLARVTRVEPSLQAAFVEYGGNRHGFLPFSEIHPDYYRIPTADREALDALENGPLEEEESQDNGAQAETPAESATSEQDENSPDNPEAEGSEASADAEAAPDGEASDNSVEDNEASPVKDSVALTASQDDTIEELAGESSVDSINDDDEESEEDDSDSDEDENRETKIRKAKRMRFLRQYKIQEVIRRKQVLLVQVTKEERGNKGAALTTYLSLAGRYSVLMPNTNKGGGISRKISSANDRKRLKDILGELKIPEGIAVIVRTAGSQRSKLEIRRDYEYLMRLWNEIRETTFSSEAPALIYGEADLIKRAIRDLYTSDMEEILVEGEQGYKSAKSFMRTLMPSHAKKVKNYKGMQIPLFHRFQVESQIDAMHNPTVKLKSGGYIVINPTEALVAIDVNSGRATKERHIEETAFKTNLEAAEEVARQVRLRDLAGLVVIDFIDMDDNKHNREVERRLKEAMSVDRARIQMGRISPFGLLEMSRQRLRPSIVENSTVVCPHCEGIGSIRTIESAALHVLRVLEEDGIRRGGGSIDLDVPTSIALFILNQKRSRLIEIEQRYSFEVSVNADDTLKVDQFRLERVVSRNDGPVSELMVFEETDRQDQSRNSDDGEDGSDRKRRKRRRRRKDRDEDGYEDRNTPSSEESADDEDGQDTRDEASDSDDDERPRKRRRRGKRGGRRRGRRREELNDETAGEEDSPESEPSDETSADTETSSDTDEEDKPARNRRVRSRSRRSRKDETSEEAPTQDAEESSSSAQEAEANADAEAEKPKKEPRKRTRSRKKESPEAAPSSEEQETQQSGDEAETTPRVRRGRPSSRSKKAQQQESAGTEVSGSTGETVQQTEDLVVDIPIQTAPAAVAETPAPASESAPAEPVSQTVAASDQSTASAPAEQPEKPDRPKRSGWWSR
ncbi:Rne/Rng family ribonuclease [Kiloniella sp. b19]|uniref:Rne/Rng family ribonuclease n=1 Tax=Kiloniella sp. GXU_MW_B19 TaxID=3141326 RepID=UPI0031DC78F5